MSTYAARTNVSPAQRRAEIERILERYKATAFGYAASAGRAQIVFEMGGRRMRMEVRLPDREDREFTHLVNPPWKHRSETEAERLYQQVVRQRWAALALYLKAVCEAIENGVVTPEIAFQPYIVLPSGETLHEALAPQLEKAYGSGEMPALLPGG